MMLNNLFSEHRGDNQQTSKPKIRPTYSHELLTCPHISPVFITAEFHSLHFMRRFQFICLFCDQSVHHYDLSFSLEREVWVLYSKKAFFAKTMLLAQAIQRSGASKILVIKIYAKRT